MLSLCSFVLMSVKLAIILNFRMSKILQVCNTAACVLSEMDPARNNANWGHLSAGR